MENCTFWPSLLQLFFVVNWLIRDEFAPDLRGQAQSCSTFWLNGVFLHPDGICGKMCSKVHKGLHHALLRNEETEKWTNFSRKWRAGIKLKRFLYICRVRQSQSVQLSYTHTCHSSWDTACHNGKSQDRPGPIGSGEIQQLSFLNSHPLSFYSRLQLLIISFWRKVCCLPFRSLVQLYGTYGVPR